MNYGYTCAMCGESAGAEAPEAGFKVPPSFIPAFRHSESAPETAEITGKTSVDLCSECSAKSETIVREGRSPVPEWDATRVHWPNAERDAALLSMDRDEKIRPEDLKQDGLTEKMVEDALLVVRQAERGEADRLLRSTVVESLILVLTARQFPEVLE